MDKSMLNTYRAGYRKVSEEIRIRQGAQLLAKLSIKAEVVKRQVELSKTHGVTLESLPKELDENIGKPMIAAESSCKGDFTDTRVILVRKEDSRVCSRTESECHIEQGFDTPTYVVIGATASDDQMEKVSMQYGIPLHELHEFRDGLA